MLSVKQDSIKYHFLSLWYDSTWDWTQISRAIGEHSNHYAIVLNSHTWYHVAVCKQIVSIKFDKSIYWIELIIFKSNTWNHFTVCKQMRSGYYKNYYRQTIRLQINMHKQNLALNNLYRLLCHKTKFTNQPTNRPINPIFIQSFRHG